MQFALTHSCLIIEIWDIWSSAPGDRTQFTEIIDYIVWINDMIVCRGEIWICELLFIFLAVRKNIIELCRIFVKSSFHLNAVSLLILLF